ncbi:DUF547 domain-containing protein [Halobacteriovorax sp.]|uniref:DUF547 domain-containing protein n=1 Tax=Halobacteriovorax sp. TaxID=2020862 RepID=UPI003AF27467
MKFFSISVFIFINIFVSHTYADFKHSHEKWNQVLKQYTDKKDNQVYFNYKELNKNQKLLNAYLLSLESITQDEFDLFTQDQKIAFWINAYNAYTIKVVLKNYPVKSIRDISSGWFSTGPWKIKFIKLLGNKVSLDNIEHDIIRKQFYEPRIHFAVNCASIGCPSLLQEAFVADKLDSQLDKAAQNFLHNKSKNYLKGNTLYLSKIFKWYGSDFNQGYGSFKKYVVKVLGLSNREYEVEFNEYDWNLNELK